MGQIESLPLDDSLADARGLLQRLRSPASTDVASLMDGLSPLPSDRPGDQSAARQRISAAYLAGLAQAQDDLLLKPRGHFVQAAIAQGRSLLKNRACSPAERLQHAFEAGLRAARVGAPLIGDTPQAPPRRSGPLKLFVRQPFTEAGEAQQAVVSQVLERLKSHDRAPHRLHMLTGAQAQSAGTFRSAFEAETGKPFSAHAFRSHRLRLLAGADAFVNVRVGMSESSAFELCWHIFSGACTPVLFLVWKHAPIKTTLLKELDALCDVTYLEFEQAHELDDALGAFFTRLVA
jgi:hypothetical protein